MPITRIELTKKGRYSIFLDDEFVCALHSDVFFAKNLSVGDAVSEEELLELKNLSEEKITRDRAFKLLSARAYTAKGLYDKLLPYAEPFICEQTVERMEELGLINDEEYAFCYARDLYNLRRFSSKRIVYELMSKGIDKELAILAADQFDVDEDVNRISEIIEIRYKNNLSEPKIKDRAFRYLMGQGFAVSDIKSAMKLVECGEENVYDE